MRVSLALIPIVRIGAALRGGGGELVQRIKTSVLINLSYDKKPNSEVLNLKAYSQSCAAKVMRK